MQLVHDATWTVVRDDETGQVYWSGGCEGDKDKTVFDPGDPLILDPKYFPVGYRITGETPLEEPVY